MKMINNYRTNFVIAIVEGGSDAGYLTQPLNAYFKVKYGASCKTILISDLTSDPYLTDEEFSKLSIFVESELSDSRNKFDKEVARNIIEVVHIIDIDEAFISDDLIHEDKTKSKYYYTREGIYYHNPEDVKERNNRKLRRVRYLLSLNKINLFGYEIDYSIYFYSINIDDFHGFELNITTEEKNKHASEFERDYIKKSDEGKIKKFLKTFDNNPSDFPINLKDTWEYIIINNNSLKPCSNAYLIVNKGLR